VDAVLVPTWIAAIWYIFPKCCASGATPDLASNWPQTPIRLYCRDTLLRVIVAHEKNRDLASYGERFEG
jgi:hypothetical protein